MLLSILLNLLSQRNKMRLWFEMWKYGMCQRVCFCLKSQREFNSSDTSKSVIFYSFDCWIFVCLFSLTPQWSRHMLNVFDHMLLLFYVIFVDLIFRLNFLYCLLFLTRFFLSIKFFLLLLMFGYWLFLAKIAKHCLLYIDPNIFYIPLISIASQRHTCPKAPSPRILKNFNLCLGKFHRSDFSCEFELLVDSCDVA